MLKEADGPQDWERLPAVPRSWARPTWTALRWGWPRPRHVLCHVQRPRP